MKLLEEIQLCLEMNSIEPLAEGLKRILACKKVELNEKELFIAKIHYPVTINRVLTGYSECIRRK